ncbi:metal-dependent transcriptional regulator [Sulfolobus sp. E1]|uniref:metal-dependent transcriptional regulator n=1 Tax=Saccharolobus sp. A20 TaxID=1891280 RepID=UPI000845BEC3|nr:metal-dependent transcriptional regulator [Sulfolobus sp. A20]TRM75632.1 metal-dependent transcriptional regulator [Sulfolobus sp. A20-N-F8]TRM79156.1 metal-dependent transcriptional regulator [Sulfolobus sp. B5]TRM80256.1 metal-dependent transcriptional regulator [Sulfolobus sp. D5]TRM89250.1 metal-dependent transcriptional regulator [Sulfolobus sp. C3]TRM97756.1 metal-dependent transcriptional regulator [Sulfolobus sp. E1]TRN01393.1 metal-dependent transcriptional regulator [Sulfolobus s
MKGLSEPLENYLKEIYELEEIKGGARVSDLIEIFNISPGTISKALNRLEKLGLIERSSDRKIKLTDEGKKVAERLIKSHRLSERLLTDVLKVDWIRAHELAHRLEHIWPDDIIEKIDEILGHPTTCPHGHPIEGRVKIYGKRLSQLKNGHYKVIMIIREEEWILREVTNFGLKPGIELEVLNNEVNNIIIKVNGEIEKIPKIIAEQVLVSE